MVVDRTGGDFTGGVPAPEVAVVGAGDVAFALGADVLSDASFVASLCATVAHITSTWLTTTLSRSSAVNTTYLSVSFPQLFKSDTF